MPSAVANIFRQAAELNRHKPQRDGNLVRLAADRQLVVSGDIHGNRTNLAKIIEYAKLAQHGNRYLVLQEIIHGPPDPKSGHDRSCELLLRAARLKIAHPEQVIFLLGNHDIAQATGNEILKDGKSYCKSFSEGLAFAFADDADDASDAINDFLLSAPLAVLCPNKVLVTHSVPDNNKAGETSSEILTTPFEQDDLSRGGRIYEWTWGRAHCPEGLEKLGKALDVEFFVLSHQHVQAGCAMVGTRGLYISSEHEHGCIIHFPTDAPLTEQNAASCVKKIVALNKPT